MHTKLPHKISRENMKLVLAAIALLFSGVDAFAPSTPRSVGREFAVTIIRTTTLRADPTEDEKEGGFDLDLGEMFDMYVPV